MPKLKTIAILISTSLIASNASAVITDLYNDVDGYGPGYITGNGELLNGGTYHAIGMTGESNTISVGDNGGVTINYSGKSVLVPFPGVDADNFQLKNAISIVHGGTLNLGSGSVIHANYESAHPGDRTVSGILISSTFDGTGVPTQGKGTFIAANLNLDVSNHGDDQEAYGLNGMQDDAFIELSGKTDINISSTGFDGFSTGINAATGTRVTAEDLDVTATAPGQATGIFSQAGKPKLQPGVAKTSEVVYRDADIDLVAGTSTGGVIASGGKITATGDTLITAVTNNSGGDGNGFIQMDYLGVSAETDSQGKATVQLKSGADNTLQNGVYTIGAAQFTGNDVNVHIDTQGHRLTQGNGLYATGNGTAGVAGKIDINGTLEIDVVDNSHSGTYHFIRAEQGGEITLNGSTFLGLAYNDANATAILATNAGSQVIVNPQQIQIVGTIEATDAGRIDLNANNVSQITGGFVTGTGGISNLSLADHSVWNMTKNSQLTNLALDDSTLNFRHDDMEMRKLTRDVTTFKTLTVDSNYVGNNGSIVMNTQLGDDNSPTDRLIVKGSTSGTTNVKVVNSGGTGGHTINGIELITVGGTSAGEFRQDGRIVAGAYDYTLQRGNGLNAKNWYLSNELPGVAPAQPDPTVPSDPVFPRERAVRPEAGLYAMNLQAANTMFNTRLQDRLGETHYVDALTGENAVTSMWLRNVGGHTRQHDSSDQLAMQANRYVMQLGGDIAQWSSDNTDRYHLGLMAGYANQKARAENQRNGNRADSRVSGYSVGLYGTWLQDNTTHEGAYVDTWAQYSWFDNTVTGHGLKSEEYDSDGFTASVESGYTWKLADISERTELYIQPKAQITWMGVKADEHKEVNGTRVNSKGDGNVQTRVGVRLFGNGHNKLDDGKDRTFQPFVEVNWIHNTKDFSTSLNGENVNLAGTRNIGELKTGVEGQLTKNVSLWGNVSQQVGDKSYSDTSAMVGIKASF
jgi:autotransporter family porin